MIAGSVLIGADEFIAEQVAARIPYMHNRSFGPCTALGIVKWINGERCVVGGVVYHNFVGHDCQVSIAVARVTFMPWRALFDYPFNQLGCVRLTALIGRKNKKSRALCERLGFKVEGVHLKGLDGREDAISYGMLRSQCRWLKENRNGQRSTPSSHAA